MPCTSVAFAFSVFSPFEGNSDPSRTDISVFKSFEMAYRPKTLESATNTSSLHVECFKFLEVTET